VWQADRLIASDKIESTALRQAQFDAVLGTIGFDYNGGHRLRPVRLSIWTDGKWAPRDLTR
jgi:ABC-type branched-subunit amino acid transport system substrate-binding protein